MNKISIILIIILLIFSTTVFADFELTGKYENSDNTYLSNEIDLKGDITDQYHYDKVWIKLKNKLDYPDYYYFKIQFNNKFYNNEISNNSKTFDIWGNYTYEFSDDYRNKFYVSFKDKNYYNNIDSSYHKYGVSYQFRMDVDDSTRYTFDIDTKKYDYFYDESKNYNINTYQVNWEKDLSEKLEVGLKYEIKEKSFLYETSSDSKTGQKVSIDFKYDL